MKACSKCGNEYPNNSFEKGRGQCKDCLRELRAIWARNYRATLSLEEKIVVAEQQAKWYLLNKEKVKITQSEYQKERKAADLVFKIRSNVSTLISRALKHQNSTKSGKSCLQYLPYSINDLLKHLESLFAPWMNWNNYGKYDPLTWNDNDPSTWVWNLDHIVPQSDLLYTSMKDDNFKKCWDLSNLRPYSARQNYLDGINKLRHNKQ